MMKHTIIIFFFELVRQHKTTTYCCGPEAQAQSPRSRTRTEQTSGGAKVNTNGSWLHFSPESWQTTLGVCGKFLIVQIVAKSGHGGVQDAPVAPPLRVQGEHSNFRAIWGLCFSETFSIWEQQQQQQQQLVVVVVVVLVLVLQLHITYWLTDLLNYLPTYLLAYSTPLTTTSR